MGYTTVKRDDQSKFNEFPKVTIRGRNFQFNSKFCEIAELSKKKRVSIKVDENARKIGFEFLESDDTDGFMLFSDGGSRGTSKKSRIVSASQILNRYDWIRSVSLLKDSDLKKFDPQWNKFEKLWEINLIPAFEVKVSNQSQVGLDVQGVYRYLRKDGSIVYVGRGRVKSRLSSPERKIWDFDTIEYSIIPDENQQIKWESFWLDRFVQENGKLPFYNQISGQKELATNN